MTLDSLRLLVRLAADESTLVRKAALTSICGLFEGNPSNDQLQKLWLDTVLPLVGDQEATVEAKAIDSVRDVLLNGLQADAGTALPPAWTCLVHIAADADLEACLRKAIEKLVVAGDLNVNKLVKHLQQTVETAHSSSHAVEYLRG